MTSQNLRRIGVIALISVAVGGAIAFVMLGVRPRSETGIYGVAIALEMGSVIFGELIRNAIPEGGPGAYVALHMLTFATIWTVVTFLLLSLGFLVFKRRAAR